MSDQIEQLQTKSDNAEEVIDRGDMIITETTRRIRDQTQITYHYTVSIFNMARMGLLSKPKPPRKRKAI